MAYVRTNWIDDVTPLDADHFNNIEDGVEEAQVEPDVVEIYEALGLIVEEG